MLKTFFKSTLPLYIFFFLSFTFLGLPLLDDNFSSGDLIIFVGIGQFILYAYLVIGAVGIFGCLKQFFIKADVNSKSKHRIFVSAASLLWFVFVFIFVVGTGAQKKFDIEQWHNSSKIGIDTERQRMRDDLTQNFLPNKTRSELEQLLGQPAKPREFVPSGNELVYILGIDRGFMDATTHWLIIRFDSSEVYESYEVRTITN